MEVQCTALRTTKLVAGACEFRRRARLTMRRTPHAAHRTPYSAYGRTLSRAFARSIHAPFSSLALM